MTMQKGQLTTTTVDGWMNLPKKQWSTTDKRCEFKATINIMLIVGFISGVKEPILKVSS